MPMPEGQQSTAASNVHAHDAMREAPRVGDAVDGDGGSGDRAAGAHLPENPPAPRRDAVEHAVVGAEEHASAGGCGRGIDVRPGAETPEIAAARREGGERAAG